jgi:hypothetical protein
VSWTGRLLGFRRRMDTDPPDPWEIPLAIDIAPRLEPQRARAYRPHSLRQVRPEAVDALLDAVAIRQAADLLVIPATMRPNGRIPICTPTVIVGVGESGVGLWADDLGDGQVVATIPYDEVQFIETRFLPGYVRAHIVGTRSNAVFRCPHTAKPAVSALLARIRRAATVVCAPAGRSMPLPAEWNAVAAALPVGLSPDAPTTSIAAPARRRWPYFSLAIISDRELILLRDRAGLPVRGPDVDSIIVPRYRLNGIQRDRLELRILIDRKWYCIIAGSTLTREMSNAFKSLLPWTADAFSPSPVRLS